MTKIRQGFRLCEIGDEFVIVAFGLDNVNFSKVISLNEPAAYLWKKAIELDYFDTDMLTNFLLEEYDVAPETAKQDAADFICQLEKQELAE